MVARAGRCAVRLVATTWLTAACGSGDGAQGDAVDGSGSTGITSTTTTTQSGTASSSGGADSTSTDAEEDTLPGKEDVFQGVACDVWTGEPCEAGEKCMPWDATGAGTWNGTRCSPIAPEPVEVGQPCTVEESPYSGLDDCGAFSMCWAVDPRTLRGHCVAFCETETQPTCAGPCEACSATGGGSLILCVPECDPLLQDCPSGQGCYGHVNGFLCWPFAGDSDSPAAGDPCQSHMCPPGLVCATGGAVDCGSDGGCCTPYCDLSDATACAALPGTECVPWFESPGRGDGCFDVSNVGACLLPD